MKQQKLKLLLPVFAWALLILVLSARAKVQIRSDFLDLISFDKWAHAFVYGVLSFLSLRAFRREKNNLFTVLIIIGLCSAYGLSLEWMQYTFFPDRYFEWLDALANAVGATIGAILFKFYYKTNL